MCTLFMFTVCVYAFCAIKPCYVKPCSIVSGVKKTNLLWAIVYMFNGYYFKTTMVSEVLILTDPIGAIVFMFSFKIVDY